MGAGTLVNVYSTTKGMIDCAHQLIERGLLDIEAPVAHYWPEFATAGKDAITLRWLLSHKAGLCGISVPLPNGALYDWEVMCAALLRRSHGGHRAKHTDTTRLPLASSLVRWYASHGREPGEYFRNKCLAEPLGADFHIGLPAEHDSRTTNLQHADREQACRATLPQPRVAEFGQLMMKPGTMQWAAFLNLPQDRNAVNTRQWRQAEISRG